MSQILGIDIGGTGTKGAIVDTITGELLTERIKYGTPKPSYPQDVVAVVKQIKEDHRYDGDVIGFGFPAVVQNGYCRTASNIDKSWIDANLRHVFEEELGAKCYFLNDADAAALAEVKFGSGRDCSGTLLMITLGTGVGSGLYRDGVLVPNVELGCIPWRDSILEHYCSNHARKSKDLSWADWGTELDLCLKQICKSITPDLIMLGGGVSKKFESFRQYLDLPAEIVPASLQNEAGVVGAAIFAERHN